MYVTLKTAITLEGEQLDVEVEGSLKVLDDPCLHIDGIWLNGTNLFTEQSERGAEARAQIEAKYDRLQDRAVEDAGYTFRNPSGDPATGRWRAV